MNYGHVIKRQHTVNLAELAGILGRIIFTPVYAGDFLHTYVFSES
ncbi:hypothetical protein XBKQ1_2150064 [Xenorhabdus bovienii str. kraussei Quebec]|uniref:Uncharacterized protein n=1 Tax=Xenorhabdus bovienii str. kraussei Quebec TaxID=1398203 RepID=A0A077PEA9_XENBV|nr:hypothetical protein XBKQ1_2150064 [Xenorhabdus bovienii str. kraussei Quebec]